MTEISIALFAALLPAIVLVSFIYWKDKEHPEPTKLLVKGVIFGILSAVLSMSLSFFVLSNIAPSFIYQIPILSSIFISFFNAALPEETAKLIMLWLLLRKNKEFDEGIDAIVYSVCIGMGFAGLENVLYVFNSEDWTMTAFTRAFLAVPGHYIDAVLMGFFYALVHFKPKKFRKYKYCIWFAPFIAHGIYDSLCFTIEEFRIITPIISCILTFALLYFCFRMHRFCLSRIESIKNIDKDLADVKLFEEGIKNEK